MKRQMMVVQAIKSFIFIALVLEIGDYLFGLYLPIQPVISMAAIGGLLSLINMGVFYKEKQKADGQILVNQKQQTLSFRINMAVDSLVNKDEITLQVNKLDE